jgi:hypothetical protein
MARSIAMLLFVLVAACGPKDQGATRHPLSTDVVQDGGAVFDLAAAYQAGPEGQITLFLSMTSKSLQETDKLVVAVELEGFVVTEGHTEWTGFVPPRQPQRHQVTVRALEVEHARLLVTVRRSVDSEVLAARELPFRVSGTVVTPE